MADELKDQRVPIMMTPSELEALDDWMFKNRIRSRGEAIRRLVSVGLNAEDALGAALEEDRKQTEVTGEKVRDLRRRMRKIEEALTAKWAPPFDVLRPELQEFANATDEALALCALTNHSMFNRIADFLLPFAAMSKSGDVAAIIEQTNQLRRDLAEMDRGDRDPLTSPRPLGEIIKKHFPGEGDAG